MNKIAVEEKVATAPKTRIESRKIDAVFNLLRYTYGLLGIIAGLDKFTDYLVAWNIYLSPVVTETLNIPAGPFMYAVGVIEVIAGVLVFARPRMGAYTVSAWLILIVINLLTTGQYFDIAVRDTVMAIGAFALAQLSEMKGK